MVAWLAWIKEKYGSAEKCVVDLGLLTPEAVEKLRQNLIVDGSSADEIDWQEHGKLVLTEEDSKP